MNNFEIPIPRVAIGIAAVAMTALTHSLLVVLPSKMERETLIMLAAPKAIGPGATEPANAFVCIELGGAHDQQTAFRRGHGLPGNDLVRRAAA